MSDFKDYTINTLPPTVGFWVMPGSVPACYIKFNVHTKPTWLHIKMMKLLLGWKYEEMK